MNIGYSVLWVGMTMITLINFVVKIFCSALVMGVSAVGLFGGCGRVGLGAFKHIVIFDFLCL